MLSSLRSPPTPPPPLQVVEACTTDARLETLQSLSEKLDLCQKSLSEYLDAKRNAFPRFFFISDDELLSVLVRPSICVVPWGSRSRCPNLAPPLQAVALRRLRSRMLG